MSGYKQGAAQIPSEVGNLIALTQLNPTTYAVITPVAGTTSFHLGEIVTSAPQQTADKTELKNEKGKTIRSSYTFNLMTTGTLAQTNKALVDFLSKTVKGKVYLEYRYQGINNGNHQEIFKIVNVTPQHNFDSSNAGASMPYESTGIFPAATVTINSTVLTSIETALSIAIQTTGVSITSDDGEIIKETAVA